MGVPVVPFFVLLGDVLLCGCTRIVHPVKVNLDSLRFLQKVFWVIICNHLRDRHWATHTHAHTRTRMHTHAHARTHRHVSPLELQTLVITRGLVPVFIPPLLLRDELLLVVGQSKFAGCCHRRRSGPCLCAG